MVKVLLGKQFAEMFRSYLYDAKKNKARSKLSTTLYFVFFAVLLVGVIGGMFTFLSVVMCEPLAKAGMGWLYFAIMGLIAIVFGAFGSVFNTFSGLYLAKDNDLLLSMPIPVSVIMTSRLLGVYLMGLMYSSMVALPAVIVYLAVCRFSFETLVCGILFVFLISIIDLELSCVLGWVVAKLSQKLKNKSFVTVLLALVFFGLYYFVCFKAQTVITDLIMNVSVYGMAIKGKAYPVYLFGMMGEGDWTATLIYYAVFGALFALMWYVISRSFIKIVTTNAGSKTKGAKASFEFRSVKSTLFSKELARFTSSANYMLNCGFGTLFIVVAFVAILLKGGTLASMISQMFGSTGAALIILLGGICCIACMNDMATPSISLEGRSIWILQSLPVSPYMVLSAKLKVQIVLTLVPVVLCLFAIVATVPCNAIQFILGSAFAMLNVNLMALFGIFLGLKMPNLTWTSELIPIKQSFSVMIALIGGFLFNAAFVGLYFLVGRKVGEVIYLCLAILATAVLGFVLNSWLKNKGSRIFAEL